MKTKLMLTALMVILLAFAIPSKMDAQANFSFQLALGGRHNPANSFYVSLGNTYNVPYRDIYVMRDAGVRDDDMPTILYIYRHSNYSLRQIYSLRMNGATWDQLSNWCGVPLSRGDGHERAHRDAPHGNAYGHYRHGHDR